MTENSSIEMPRDISEHVATWGVYQHRSTIERAIERGGDSAALCPALYEMPEVSALEALRANREAVVLLVGRRWLVIQDAREAGKPRRASVTR